MTNVDASSCAAGQGAICAALASGSSGLSGAFRMGAASQDARLEWSAGGALLGALLDRFGWRAPSTLRSSGVEE